MKIKLTIILLFYSVAAVATMAGRGIRFQKIDLTAAIAIAKQQNKYVFVDTYASWCAPCKIMDKVFEEELVGDFFNNQFVNVKIDMDGPQGDQMLYDYEVVWLPTLLIIDANGHVLSKIDQLVNSSELLATAKSAISGLSGAGPVSSLKADPFVSSGEASPDKDYNPLDKEEVIYVYDEKSSSGRPHIMYHEAYLHLQLMDGQHQKVVNKYLSTQKDWSTPKNIRFIFDFLQNVRSPLFEYFVTHRAQFEAIIDKSKVQETIEILVWQHLNTGFPRPNFEESKRFLQYIDPLRADQMAYTYFLPRLEKEGNIEAYKLHAKEYLRMINPYDTEVISNYISYRLKDPDIKSTAEEIELMDRALILESQNYKIYMLAAQLYFHQRNKTKAQEHIAKAIALARHENQDISALLALQDNIISLY